MGLACSLVALALAGGGGGVKQMETVMQDDALLLHRPPEQVRRHAHEMAASGTDRVRITAGWSALAPAPRSPSKPGPPFNPYDSRTYSPDGWRRLDTAVRAAVAEGLAVELDVGFWAPRWAVSRPGRERDRQRYAPDAREFGAFAAAVARRYDGTFPDPERQLHTLPEVRMYATWNEPNNAGFLQPQWVASAGGGLRPESPHVYRHMHQAAYAAIKHVNPADRVLMGGTASGGSGVPGRGGVKPLRFLRELACVDDRLAPLAVPECASFTPLRADGWANHPYSPGTAPGASDPDPDDARLADTARLWTLLHELHVRGRIASDLLVYDNEYGYESRPPDPYQRVTALQQARFMGQATFLAWRDGSTVMFGQFLLRDIAPLPGARPRSRRAWRDFQSGLYFSDGRPKPALRAFRLPFWAQPVAVGGRQAVLLFGQVRPGSGSQPVRVERRGPGRRAAWRPVSSTGRDCTSTTDFATDSAGFFLRVASLIGPGSYRLVWRSPAGAEAGVSIPVRPLPAGHAGAR